MSTVARTQLDLITAACTGPGVFDISGRELADTLSTRMVHVETVGRAVTNHLQALADEAAGHSHAVDRDRIQDALAVIEDAMSDIVGALMRAADEVGA